MGVSPQMSTRTLETVNVYFLPDVRELSSTHSITSSSLHVYRSWGSGSPTRNYESANMTQESAKPIKINRTQPEVFVYRLMGENPLTRILVTSRKLELEGAEAWETFEVSSAMKDWFSSSRSQLSLQIVCSNCDFIFKSVTSSQEIHFSHRVPPQLAVLELGLSRRSGRSKRNVRHTRKYPLDCTRGKRTKRCCRYKMKVSFHSIPLKGTGWDSIIEPKEFDAFVCKGKCNKRSKSILNTHALLQNRLRRVKKSEIPRLCCTSKRRKPLVVKVVDSQSQRRQGKIDDMIVTECGCG